jgi:ABC-type maltose transport system permease subunit
VAAYGLPPDEDLIGYGGHNVHESRQALRQMLRAGVDFTAVLTSNDESALGAMQAFPAALAAMQAFPAALALPAFYLILLRLNLLNSHLGLILIYAAGATAFNIWNIKGYFDTIPVDLAEAAMIDGASPTQAFVLVMLPLARPVLAVTALFGFLAGFSDFILANTVLFDERLFTAPVGVFSLQTATATPGAGSPPAR